MPYSQATTTTSPVKYCINYQDVLDASKRIKPLVHRTPVLTASSINTLCNNRQLFFKVEAMQRTGSFKFRGACNATLALTENHLKSKNQSLDKDCDGNGKDDGVGSNHISTTDELHVVAHSSGNHAAAVALAATEVTKQYLGKLKIKSTIVMPRNAPTVKVRGVKGFGGDIIFVDNTNEAREEMADTIVERDAATFIHPSENELVIAGQGTVCFEMVEQVKEMLHEDGENCALDVVIIPVGGGGLASGNTIALRGLLGDKVKIVLAEPAELDDARRSKDAGKLIGHHATNTLNSCADGLKTTLGANTWPIVRDLVDDIFVVSEKDILRATKLIWERLKVTIEPSAGVGVAVALGDEFQEKYSISKGFVNVGVILCGGNVDIIKTCHLMTEKGL